MKPDALDYIAIAAGAAFLAFWLVVLVRAVWRAHVARWFPPTPAPRPIGEDDSPEQFGDVDPATMQRLEDEAAEAFIRRRRAARG